MRNRFSIHKIVINKRFMPLLILGILLCTLCMGSVSMTALAETAGSDFYIEAALLPSAGNTYDISMTVANTGRDWEGTVRLLLDNGYSQNVTAYDTVIALPQNSTKQFVVKVPKKSVDAASTTINAVFLDKRSKVVAETALKQFRWDEKEVLPMGILSDNYSALTYLDMGGERLYYYDNNYPIKLMELSQDNLRTSLDSLVFLVIDNYNTGILSEETLDAIDKWVQSGGVLIIGTGSWAEEVLSGFDNLGITCGKIYAPGEYEIFSEVTWDVTKVTLAELIDENFQYEMAYDNYINLMKSKGDGAVGVLPYSLTDFGKLGKDAYIYGTQEEIVQWFLEAISSESSAKHTSQNTTVSRNMQYLFSDTFAALGSEDGRLNFGVLKVLVVLYVIFVGPVLYLILRITKKREMYWLAVPAAALLGIFLVSLAGRGFEVKNTRVYSVTVSDLSHPGNAQTYMRCYDVNYNEWNLQLMEGYESIGPVAAMRSYSRGDAGYYYHVKKEGERLRFGADPEKSFEDCYFLTGNAPKVGSGSLELGDLHMPNSYTLSGTVSNKTDRDFPYIAIIANNQLFVYKDLPAGKTSSLKDLKVVSGNSGAPDVYRAYRSEVLTEAARDNKRDLDVLAALGLGIYQVYPKEDDAVTAVIGVTKDWEKAVDDNCREISYGCLYQIQ